MDYIAQFITDIRHVRRPDNPVADALLGIATLAPVQSIDFPAIVSSQHTDEDLMCYLNDPDSSLLTLQTILYPPPMAPLPVMFQLVNHDRLCHKDLVVQFLTPSTTSLILVSKQLKASLRNDMSDPT